MAVIDGFVVVYFIGESLYMSAYIYIPYIDMITLIISPYKDVLGR